MVCLCLCVCPLGRLTYDAPNKRLYEFTGTLDLSTGRKVPIGKDQVLLRVRASVFVLLCCVVCLFVCYFVCLFVVHCVLYVTSSVFVSDAQPAA